VIAAFWDFPPLAEISRKRRSLAALQIYTPLMRRIAMVIVTLIAVPIILLGPRGSVVALKTAVFIPEIFPDAPVKPLRWFTTAATVERTSIAYAAGTAQLNTYVPARAGPHGAVILMLGARPVDPDDPVVTSFADGLSRLGVVVLVPASEGLAAGRITPEEIDLLVREHIMLRERPDVDPGRVGFIGLSVGGSLSLMAAADPRIRDSVAFVNAFGAYFDARDLFVALASRSLSYAGEPSDWDPAPLAREVMVENLAQGLGSEEERECIRAAADSATGQPSCDPGSLSPPGQIALELLAEPDTVKARQYVDLLAATAESRLEAISPRSVIDQITADVLVMHDVHDHYIPFTESRRLMAALPHGRLRAWTELELFDHVMPGQRLDPLSFAREMAQLFQYVYLTFLEIL
jgi:dienelactone hydrolase